MTLQHAGWASIVGRWLPAGLPGLVSRELKSLREGETPAIRPLQVQDAPLCQKMKTTAASADSQQTEEALIHDTPCLSPVQALVYLSAPLLASVSRSFAAWAESTASREVPTAIVSRIKKSRAARKQEWSRSAAKNIRIG